MNALTLQWHDAGQDKTQKIYEQPVRIGRDPSQCDIVVSNGTVSGLHVAIFFHSQQQKFYIRNLREPNPPLVDGQQLFHGEMPLKEGSVIYLGQMEFKVTNIVIDSFPATILAPPQPPAHQHQRPKTPLYQSPQVQQHHPIYPPTPPPLPVGAYGLECSKCHKVSPLEKLNEGCHWCGTSLAAAVSVLVTPGN
ncbi:FHA domain-containing protein [Calothrix sp. PCC 7507]|uniref:FHA domain-containing protein n=1 Tax=Calothrix sp. PCC 7507 TaxID=99598 RepID=UPI00029EFE03|nr:FHA domain-containing protein [Calothrix sp. PCC 7507]AFY33970.1 Forkhead-associated protein [Calothrix sp. PCC 7507]